MMRVTQKIAAAFATFDLGGVVTVAGVQAVALSENQGNDTSIERIQKLVEVLAQADAELAKANADDPDEYSMTLSWAEYGKNGTDPIELCLYDSDARLEPTKYGSFPNDIWTLIFEPVQRDGNLDCSMCANFCTVVMRAGGTPQDPNNQTRNCEHWKCNEDKKEFFTTQCSFYGRTKDDCAPFSRATIPLNDGGSHWVAGPRKCGPKCTTPCPGWDPTDCDYTP